MIWVAAVSGTTMVVEENRFPTSFWTIRQGRDRPCSCPTTGSSETSTTMPRYGFPTIRSLPGRPPRNSAARARDSYLRWRHRLPLVAVRILFAPCISFRNCSTAFLITVRYDSSGGPRAACSARSRSWDGNSIRTRSLPPLDGSGSPRWLRVPWSPSARCPCVSSPGFLDISIYANISTRICFWAQRKKPQPFLPGLRLQLPPERLSPKTRPTAGNPPAGGITSLSRLPQTPSACGCGWDDAACAAPWLRFAGFFPW